MLGHMTSRLEKLPSSLAASAKRNLATLRIVFFFGVLMLIAYRKWKAYTKKAVAHWRQLLDHPETDLKTLEDGFYARIAEKVASLSDADIQRRIPEECDFVVR